MADSEGDPEDEAVPEGHVGIHYIKSAQFRVVHVDGAWGSLSPNGSNLTIAAFNERTPLPRKTIHELSAEGRLGPETAKLTRDGFVREVEVELVMSLEVAETIATWLAKKVRDARELTAGAGPASEEGVSHETAADGDTRAVPEG